MRQRADELSRVSDEELVALGVSLPQHFLYPLEMQRRLRASIDALRASSDRSASVLVRLTAVLVVLTAAVVAFSILLLMQA